METKGLYNSPNWILSGRTVTIVVLIVLPFAYAVSDLLITRSLNGYVTACPARYQPPTNLVFIENDVLVPFKYLLFVLILAFYPPYPFPFSRNIKDYFTRRGYETAVTEYELIKKILYIAVPLLIVTMVTIYIHSLDYSYTNHVTTIIVKNHSVKCLLRTATADKLAWAPIHTISQLVESNQDLFYYLELFLALTVFAAFLKLIFAVSRTQFRLSFAKGCFNLMAERKDEVEKMKYFVMGLNSYNSYLRRQIKLEISDLRKIYSWIASSPIPAKNELVDKVSKVFQKDMFEYEDYTLEPVRCLSRFLDTPESKISLGEESILNKLKSYAAFAVVAIPVLLNALKVAGITK
jgi:hypothetical protein